MNSNQQNNSEFIDRLTSITEANLSNPHFGVSMLAKEMGMSRSNLHRKVILHFKITVSQFVNQVRLKKAKDILRHTSDTVSEVSYKVGYNNVSYFIKCFHEYYGYPPGEVGNRDLEENDSNSSVQIKNTKLKTILVQTVFVVLLAIALIVIFKPFQFQQKKLENTIAILPPSFEFLDSSYYSTIDGIIQDVIVNLNKIDEIKKITPWFSVLQYRNTFESAPEIAEEHKTNYIVKPNVLGNSDKIILSLSLMEGPSDDFIDKYTYEIDSNNVTTVHQKILKDITNELDVSITPEEQGRIDKIITSNRKARKLYWEGVELMNKEGYENRIEAIELFKNAIKNDNEFALAYAKLAITYYYLDNYYSSDKNKGTRYSTQININADMAQTYDPNSDWSAAAKAFSYQQQNNFEMAIFYFEKALDYNSRFPLAIRNLGSIYFYHLNNPEKKLEYALMAINLDISLSDSIGITGKYFDYRNLGQALRYCGFFNEAIVFFDKSLKINPEQIHAKHFKTQTLLDINGTTYQEAKEFYLELIQKDPTNMGMYRNLYVACYKMEDYASAYKYYKKCEEIMEGLNIDYTDNESGRFAVILSKLGETEKSLEHINRYFEYAKSEANNFILARAYSLKGDPKKAIEQLKMGSQKNIPYSLIRNLKDDPIFDNIRELDEFKEILSEMETKFWENHERIKKSLKKKGILDSVS